MRQRRLYAKIPRLSAEHINFFFRRGINFGLLFLLLRCIARKNKRTNAVVRYMCVCARARECVCVEINPSHKIQARYEHSIPTIRRLTKAHTYTYIAAGWLDFIMPALVCTVGVTGGGVPAVALKPLLSTKRRTHTAPRLENANQRDADQTQLENPGKISNEKRPHFKNSIPRREEKSRFHLFQGAGRRWKERKFLRWRDLRAEGVSNQGMMQKGGKSPRNARRQHSSHPPPSSFHRRAKECAQVSKVSGSSKIYIP
jgi:hypothetical protein